MSAIDRLANLAKGVVADGQKRFDAGGGLEGATRRASERARALAESARAAVEGGLAGEPGSAAVDPEAQAWAQAQAEVDAHDAAAPVAGERGTARPAPSARDPLAAALARLDRRLHAGELDRATWEAERAALLDAHDRAGRPRSPRPRTL